MDWTIAGWIVALFVLYLIGFYEGRATGYKKRKKEELKEKENLPPPEPEKETVTETVTVTVDDPGLLRIKNEGGAYTLDLDGARVDPSVLPPDQRKRLIELISIMRPWLEGKPAPAPTSAPSPAPSGITPASQSSLLDRLQSTAAPPAPPAQTPPTPLANVHREVSAPPVPPPPPAESPAAAKPGIIAKEDRPAAPANSIVTQIDTVLQARLVGTPLAERGIFLTESPQGGVIVYVGLTPYNGIDEVPDPEIKAAIRAAITEWENKYTPGL